VVSQRVAPEAAQDAETIAVSHVIKSILKGQANDKFTTLV
jgi:hypothetical protein